MLKLHPGMNLMNCWEQGWNHAIEGLCASDKEDMAEHMDTWMECWDPDCYCTTTFQEVYDDGISAAEACYAELFERRIADDRF